MKQFTKAALTAALIIGTVNVLAAQPFCEGPVTGRHGRSPSPLMMFRFLQDRQAEFQINDQQMEQIRLKALALEKEHIRMKHDRDLLQLELKTLTTAVDRDYREVKTVLMKLAELKADFHISSMKTRDALEDILTTEQLEAIKNAGTAMIGRRHAGLRGRTGPRRDRPGIVD